jgi:hypothetical protein
MPPTATNVQVLQKIINAEPKAREPEPKKAEIPQTSIMDMFKFKAELKWLNVISISIIHIVAVLSLFYYTGRLYTTFFG